jgi:hypothetical protein
MIGAVAIVGGHRIIPFHLLPNPTEDDDDHVPSDNPYATTDENYFAPEWPVGRPIRRGSAVRCCRPRPVSTGAASNPGRPAVTQWTWDRRSFGRSLNPSIQRQHLQGSWQFSTIGAPGRCHLHRRMELGLVSRPSRFYFNLHGLACAEWFGQRSAAGQGQPEFPVALRPDDVEWGRVPAASTEACWGPMIGKTAAEALSLKSWPRPYRCWPDQDTVRRAHLTPPT